MSSSSSSNSPIASTTTGSVFSVPNNVIYLVEIIFYVVLIAFSVVVLFRQGKKNAQGWFSLTMFGGFKVVGSAMLLSVAITEHKGNTPSSGNITAGLILSSIALGPLENAGLAFLSQGSEHWHKNSSLSPGSLTARPARLIRLIVLVATILSIVGTTQMTGSGSKSTAKALVGVGSILFGAGFVLITLLAGYCFTQIGNRYSPSYKAYIFSIFCASPFFLVRIIFSIVSGFSLGDDIFQYRTFSSFNGNWRVRLVMMILMEFIISIIYCVGGYFAEFKAEDDIISTPGDPLNYPETQQGWTKGPEYQA